MLAKSLTGEETARELINTFSVTYSVRPEMLLAAMRDRASVYNVAMETMKVVHPFVVATHTLLTMLETTLRHQFSLNLFITSSCSSATVLRQRCGSLSRS